MEKHLTNNKITNLNENRKVAGPIVYNAFDNDFKKSTKNLENALHSTLFDKTERTKAIKEVKKIKNDFYKPDAYKKGIKNIVVDSNEIFEDVDDKVKNIQKMVRNHNTRKKC